MSANISTKPPFSIRDRQAEELAELASPLLKNLPEDDFLNFQRSRQPPLNLQQKSPRFTSQVADALLARLQPHQLQELHRQIMAQPERDRAEAAMDLFLEI